MIQTGGHIVLVLVLVVVLEFRSLWDSKEHETEPKMTAALNRTAFLTGRDLERRPTHRDHVQVGTNSCTLPVAR
jgi:hypothetical protein